MAIFISAGHNPKGIKTDSGAVGQGMRECDLTIEIRDLVVANLKRMKCNVITDYDTETLSEYLKRIKTGKASVVLEFHFDASDNQKAHGTTAIVGKDADRLDMAFATELVNKTAEVLQIKNRGVISEADSHRGSLGLMRKEGIVALLEIGFISNVTDILMYKKYKDVLAFRIAEIVECYEKLV